MLVTAQLEQVRESLSPRWRASGTVKGWILGDTGDEDPGNEQTY